MIVRVRLFAVLRERAGRDSLDLELPAGANVAEALAELSRHDGLGEALASMPVGVAVNREYADSATAIRAGDELALIPPVSGGAGDASEAGRPRTHVRVGDLPISAQALCRRVADPGAGAIVTFQGVTRLVDDLDYEAYREMAEARIAAILAQCVRRYGLCAAAAEHRTGRVGLGEPGVVVAVSAAHREQAFGAAREAIDRIKAEAPIWKRELEADGRGIWVKGAPPAAFRDGGRA